MELKELSEHCSRIIAEVERAVIGKRSMLELVLMGILSGGHILFEDYPGLAKTLTAKSFAAALGLEFKRIQFTPDLLPGDVTGTHIYNQKTGEFELKRGPIFANIVLADEINRAPPKTQAALLEAMQEYQVTLEGETLRLPGPFIVIATQNPIEYEGTFPLPEAQIDRFLVRLEVGYPGHREEVEMLRRRRGRKADEVQLDPVTTGAEIIEMQAALEGVYLDPDIEDYIVSLVEATRQDPQVYVGASPRGSLALMKLSRARAALDGRDYVLPDDVKAVAKPALVHRLILKPELWMRELAAEEVVERALATVPVPKVD
ncbi:MAG: MoxR family ATPase [Candidatus Acetothermia bacterium]|jgi:MoxR-like ATPase|nr:MoxR family ATPase [Candidatus Acetothermia bacterium]MDH7505134.1 MoxR family ATPase [Candidatus Acetothermia bacterium]